MGELAVRAVDRESWADFTALFESPGAPGYCWCMAWRPLPAKQRTGPAALRRAAMQALVEAGVPTGLIGYRDGVPVGWCSIAPRETYRPLGGAEAQDGERIWSLACFFVRREWRGQGLARALLAAATDHARSNGATAIEAYPVDPDSPSYRFMGFVDLFRRAGFEAVGKAGSRRHVMRLALAQ